MFLTCIYEVLCILNVLLSILIICFDVLKWGKHKSAKANYNTISADDLLFLKYLKEKRQHFKVSEDFPSLPVTTLTRLCKSDITLHLLMSLTNCN